MKKKRLNAGLTQNKLAQLCGYNSAQFISNWERGLCAPPTKHIRSIEKILKAQIYPKYKKMKLKQLEQAYLQGKKGDK